MSLPEPISHNNKKALIADYRHKGHRLNLISNLAQYLSEERYLVTVDLPEECRESEEWELHSDTITHHASMINSSMKNVPDDKHIQSWLREVLRQANAGEYTMVIIPWADKVMKDISVIIKESRDDMHVHLLIGRYAPGIAQYSDYPDPFDTLDSSIKACELAKGTNVYISRLSAAFDPIALRANTYSDNVNIINDPVDDAVAQSTSWCRGELSLPNDEQLALIAGHLSSRKKILRILKQWPDIYKKHNIKLVLAGELEASNESYEEIKKVVDDNKECIIPRFGVISVDSFPRYIKAADIVICTYEAGTYMPSGLAGLAYVNKVPVISIGNRYISDLINSLRLGVGIEIYSPLALTRAISSVKTRPEKAASYKINPTFTHTFDQMFTDCISEKETT